MRDKISLIRRRILIQIRDDLSLHFLQFIDFQLDLLYNREERRNPISGGIQIIENRISQGGFPLFLEEISSSLPLYYKGLRGCYGGFVVIRHITVTYVCHKRALCPYGRLTASCVSMLCSCQSSTPPAPTTDLCNAHREICRRCTRRFPL